jgi:tetratricopeptide (TPR) repeat protein
MKRHIVILFALLFSLPLWAQDARMANANQLYAASKFSESIAAYEDILKTGVESEALFFNLGNAYYKTGQLPLAILNFERALLIDPNDKDIIYNLELANSQIADRINSVGEFFLTTWVKRFISMADSDLWAWSGLLLFAVALVALGFFLYANTTLVKRMGFFAGIIFILLSITTLSFSYSQKSRQVNRSEGIVFAPTLNVKSSPDTSGTDLFVIHEGTKVRILDKLGSWLKVVIKDGSEGWIPANEIEII